MMTDKQQQAAAALFAKGCEACFVAIRADGRLCSAFPAHKSYRFLHVVNCYRLTI